MTMHFVGRTPIFVLLLAVIALTVNIRGSHAVDFLTRTVRIVIPFSAGGAPMCCSALSLTISARSGSSRW